MDNNRKSFIRSVVLGASLALPFFLLSLTAGRTTLFRTAREDGFFSNFFDIQARALLGGRLDLPSQILSIESFVYDGRTYMYFPPFPAIIRMPILAYFPGLEGKLTALSLLLAWMTIVVGVAGTLWQFQKLMGHERANTRFGFYLRALLIFSICGGSLLVYLASLPWVYHEVYMWAVASASLAVWCALRLMDEPTWRKSFDLTLTVTATILTRTTVGFACVAMSIGVGGFLIRKRLQNNSRAWPTALVPASVAIVSACTVTWLKFGSPFNFLPLDSQVWTQISPRRQFALEANDGGLTNFKFLTTTIPTYLDPRNIRILGHFPYISLPSSPPTVNGNVVFDQLYRTGSATAFMPGLVVCLMFAVGHLARFRGRSPMARAMIPIAGMAVASFGIFNYGYLSHRYLGDLMPLLIVGAIAGTAILQVSDLRGRRLRIAAASLLTLATIWGVVANGLVANSTSAQIARGAELRDYVSRIISLPKSDGPVVRTVGTLPQSAPADEIYVIGSCQEIFYSTGETEYPWISVGGDTHVGWLTLDQGYFPIAKLSYVDDEDGVIGLKVDGDGNVQLAIDGYEFGDSLPVGLKGRAQLTMITSQTEATLTVKVNGSPLFTFFRTKDRDMINGPTFGLLQLFPSNSNITWLPPLKDPFCESLFGLSS